MLVVGWIDEHGHIIEVGENISELLGYDSPNILGTSALEVIHPSDLERMKMYAKQAYGGRVGVTAQARARHADGAWMSLFVLLFPPQKQEADGIGFAIGSAEEPPAPARLVRLHELEHRIWRIGLEVQEAGVLGPPQLAGYSVAARVNLSPRQWAILNRLTQGQRVPTIARDLNLAQSTVRNHLTAIFRKFDVTSQEELLSKLNGNG